MAHFGPSFFEKNPEPAGGSERRRVSSLGRGTTTPNSPPETTGQSSGCLWAQRLPRCLGTLKVKAKENNRAESPHI